HVPLCIHHGTCIGGGSHSAGPYRMVICAGLGPRCSFQIDISICSMWPWEYLSECYVGQWWGLRQSPSYAHGMDDSRHISRISEVAHVNERSGKRITGTEA
ncbi:MAG: hypothetical protein ABSC14_01725, partial [Desulfomonilia bacterium]